MPSPARLGKARLGLAAAYTMLAHLYRIGCTVAQARLGCSLSNACTTVQARVHYATGFARLG